MHLICFPLLILAADPGVVSAATLPMQITEFAAAGQQGVRDEDGETPDWIELWNVSGATVNLDEWALSDDPRRPSRWKFPSTNVPAGGSLVVFASGKDRRIAGAALHTNFKLGAEGGAILLRSPSGESVGSGNYPKQIPGVTFGLAGVNSADATAPIGGTNYVYLSAPTPGRANSTALHLGPPIELLSPRHTGAQPADGAPIVVTARVTGEMAAVTDVRLHSRVMFGAELTIAMADDGARGDLAAGDGVFGASIPGNAARPGELVRFSVEAMDADGRRSRWPLFKNRTGYSAFEGTVRADASIQTRLPVVHLFVSNEPGARRAGATAALFFEGELYDNVAMSLHGQFSRSFPKQSYNLDFPADHPFAWRTNQARVKDLKLLSNFADKSRIRNTLAYETIAAVGSMGHVAFPVRMQLNGRFFSIAELIEDGDERWLERLGRDPRGALYKMYDNLSSAFNAEKKTRKEEDAGDLQALVSALSQRHSLEERAVYAYDHIDLPQCVSYLVSLALISSDDHGHKNYYLYRDTEGSGEWALLPWDVDLSFGRNWTGQYYDESIYVDNPLDLYRNGRGKARNRLYDLLFEHPEFRAMYLRRLRTVMETVLQAPGTPAEDLFLEGRVRHWMDQLDPADVKSSDADLDEANWPSWGQGGSMRDEARRIITEYLPGRRRFLFQSSRAQLWGDRIPASQPPDVALKIAAVERAARYEDSFICVTNVNPIAVDVSGWRLEGSGIEHLFRPGTVIPAGKAIYAVASAKVFRSRTSGPSGGQGWLVQGNWKGRLSAGKEPLKLIGSDGRVVAESPVE